MCDISVVPGSVKQWHWRWFSEMNSCVLEKHNTRFSVHRHVGQRKENSEPAVFGIFVNLSTNYCSSPYVSLQLLMKKYLNHKPTYWLFSPGPESRTDPDPDRDSKPEAEDKEQAEEEEMWVSHVFKIVLKHNILKHLLLFLLVWNQSVKTSQQQTETKAGGV